MDKSGAVMMLWGLDPVHPLKERYTRIADMICEAAVKLGAGSLMGPPGKKPRMEIPRPRWVEEGPPPLWFTEVSCMGEELDEAVEPRLAMGGDRGSSEAKEEANIRSVDS